MGAPETANQLQAFHQMAVALTVTDLDGRILFYNDYAARIFNRKPEHLGRDVRDCHNKDESKARIDRLLADYRAGGREEQAWQVVREGVRFQVRVAPLLVEGRPAGLIHAGMILS